MIIKAQNPGSIDKLIKQYVVFEKSRKHDSQIVFEMFANHKDVSTISRVEAKRETIATQTVMENMNIDDYQRPKTQDQTIIYQNNTLFLKESRTRYPKIVF